MERFGRHLVLTALLAMAAAPAVQAGPAEDQYNVAAGHYAAKRWRLAAEEFEKFIKYHGDHQDAPLAHFFLAEASVQLAQYDQAHEHFQAFLKRAPQHAQSRRAQFRVGETAYLLGRGELAQQQLEAFRQQHPDDALNAFALRYLAELARDEQQWQTARSLYLDALRDYPESAMADQCRFGLGDVLLQQGETAEAAKLYEYLAAKTESPLADDAQLQLALMQRNAGQFDQAATALERFRRQFPQSKLRSEADFWLGMTQLDRQEAQQALATFERLDVPEDDPSLAAGVAFGRAEALRALDRLDEATPLYERVVTDQPDSSWADDSLAALIHLDQLADRLPQLQQRVEQFHRAFPESPLRTSVQQTLARTLLKAKQYDLAIEALGPLTQSTEGDPAQQLPAAAAPSQSNEYLLALALLGADRYDECLAALDRIRPQPDNQPLIDAVSVARAQALIRQERFREAIAPLQAYLRSQPGGPDAPRSRAELAAALAQTQQWDEARQVYRQFAAKDSADRLFLPATLYLAELAYAAEKRAWAGELFSVLAQDGNPDKYRTRGLEGLAWSQLKDDRPEQSAATFDRLLQQQPDGRLAAGIAMARAQALVRTGQLDGALAMYRRVIEKHPDSEQMPTALLGAARVYVRLQRHREAAEMFGHLVRDYPKLPQIDAALYQWAWSLVDLQRPDEADAVFARLYMEHKASRYWADATYRLAERAAKAKDMDRARRLVGEIVASDASGPVRAHALYLQGQLAALAGSWTEVAAPLERLLAEFPDHTLVTPAEYWIAESLYRSDQFEQAGERFTELMRKTQGRREAWLAMLPLRQAQVLAQQSKWDEAYELAAPIAESFPNFQQLYEVDLLLGRCLAAKAQFQAARSAYQRVIDSPTGSKTETAAMAQWLVGETYWHQKNYDEAIRAFWRVESLYDYPSWRATALLEIGKCHEMKGDWQQAVDSYRRLLDEYPQQLVSEKAEQRLRVAQQRAGGGGSDAP